MVSLYSCLVYRVGSLGQLLPSDLARNSGSAMDIAETQWQPSSTGGPAAPAAPAAPGEALEAELEAKKRALVKGEERSVWGSSLFWEGLPKKTAYMHACIYA